MAPSKDKHEHPGGDVPHRHGEGDELATHESSDARTTRDESERTLELREEDLQARKQSVETGNVRIGKEVVSEQKTLEVPVTRENVTIERHPVERRPAEGTIGEQDESIRVPVHEEQVSVEKRAVVTEEIGVGKRTVQDTKQVTGTVRREEARIEGEGNVDPKQDR
ncbi:MAG: YsnF/AvaK domain-containing protein [Chloroflexi bacterium]|nr:YsnF/AvaK domain-containing protein [Chloroflexota bacterium]